VAGPWLQTLELVPQPDVLMSSPDGTLHEIAPLLNQVVGIDLDSGVDVRRLRVVMAPAHHNGSAGLPIVVGSQSDSVLQALEKFSVVQVGPRRPPGPHENPAAMVGLHGFSDIPTTADTSFSMQMIDDWGIDDVMASALDVASRQKRALAVFFDLAVLDPAYEGERTTPGGLDLRKLFRAARSCGRRADVLAAGFVKAASEVNLVHTVLTFCAGLASR